MESGIATSIITGTAALGGVVLGQLAQWLRSRADKDHERAAVLRDKLEALVDNAHTATAWMDRALESRLSRDGASTVSFRPVELSDQARRVHVLALLYFPALRDDAARLFDATTQIYALVTDRRPPNEKRLIDLSEQFRDAREALDKLVATEARKLI